jgi:hypothetical protein
LLAWPAPLYSYPNVLGSNGQLSIYHRKGLKIIESRHFLYRQVKHLHYLSDIESPMFYVKGVSSTTLVDRVRNRSKDGRFYSCPTPDGYSGIVLAGEVPYYAFSGKPFSLFGLSPDSQGLAYMSNEEKAKKVSEMFTQTVSSRPMHEELASQPYSPLISLMTVDYLLTARDLPGWPGRFPPIDYRKVLSHGIRELGHGLYGAERICSQLEILNQIAEKHGLGKFFRNKVLHSKRCREKAPFKGSGINEKAFYLDASTYHLHDIYDAAYAAKHLYQAYLDLMPSTLVKTIYRSMKYRYQGMGKGSLFPPESEWGRTRSLDE